MEFNPATIRKPRTATVLVMLSGVALLLSWLWAYAVTGALISAELLKPWPADQDPRLRWMTESFLSLLIAFILSGGLVRWLSARQLRRIDSIADAEETATDG